MRETSRTFGVRRQSEAPTALWISMILKSRFDIQSGAALRLPPHSKFVDSRLELA